eukprot:31125-Pelagococcus_subviridis.AAC.36
MRAAYLLPVPSRREKERAHRDERRAALDAPRERDVDGRLRDLHVRQLHEPPPGVFHVHPDEFLLRAARHRARGQTMGEGESGGARGGRRESDGRRTRQQFVRRFPSRPVVDDDDAQGVRPHARRGDASPAARRQGAARGARQPIRDGSSRETPRGARAHLVVKSRRPLRSQPCAATRKHRVCCLFTLRFAFTTKHYSTLLTIYAARRPRHAFSIASSSSSTPSASSSGAFDDASGDTTASPATTAAFLAACRSSFHGSNIIPKLSTILCQTSQFGHCTNIVPRLYASGFTIFVLLASHLSHVNVSCARRFGIGIWIASGGSEPSAFLSTSATFASSSSESSADSPTRVIAHRARTRSRGSPPRRARPRTTTTRAFSRDDDVAVARVVATRVARATRGGGVARRAHGATLARIDAISIAIARAGSLG